MTRKNLILFLFLVTGFASLVYAEENQFQAAMDAFRAEKYEESLTLFKELTRKYPQEPLYWFNLGSSLYSLGKYEEALDAYDKVISLGVDGKTPALFYKAKSLGKLSRYFEEATDLKQLDSEPLSDRMRKALDEEWVTLENSMLKDGVSLYRSGTYSDAATYLQRIIDIRPLAEAYFMLGMAKLREGDNKVAISSFQRVTELTSDQELRLEANDFLRRIYEGRIPSENSFFLSADFAVGYDDNLYEEAAATTSPETEFNLTGGYHFFRGKTFSFRPQYSLSYDEYINDSSLRTFLSRIEPQVIYSNPPIFLELDPFAEYETQGLTSYDGKLGATFQAKFRLGSFEPGMMVSGGGVRGLQSYYEYLNGYEASAKVYLGYYYESSFYVAPGIHFSREATGDLPFTDGTVLPLANFAVGPTVFLVWYFLPQWSLRSWFYYQHEVYDNPAAPTGTMRVDDSFLTLVKLSYNISDTLRLFGSFQHTINGSTLRSAKEPSDKNYTQDIFLIGIAWNLS